MTRITRLVSGPLLSGAALVALSAAASATELNVIIEEVPDYDIVRELTEQFEAEHPDITVTLRRHAVRRDCATRS